ncbi:primosomal protein N' [Anaerococcus sp. Marseille-Q5996]|uniref:primosomal protein N' n=1 Tax=Anaerococcus sp. Marseille-Q5996 TaxID=2972769 RepID=UPI002915F2CD|nr:primosomal protein N' [Anaerococcus sp. Marseille-Q5996]
MIYAKVIIDSKSRFLNSSFTYHIPEKFNNKIDIAMRVVVPFGRGNKNSVAFVYEMIDKIDVDYEIKDILEIIDNKRLISDELMDLAFFMSKTYMSPIQASLKQVMPPTNIKNIKTFFYSKSKEDSEILNFLSNSKTMEEITNRFGEINEEIFNLVDEGKIGISYDIKNTQNIRYDEFVFLTGKNIFLNTNAIKQMAIIDYLKKHGETKLLQVLKETQAAKSSLNALVKKGIVGVIKRESKKEITNNYNKYNKLSLNDEQLSAFEKIKSNPAGHFLLFGVTGSGKTEIFLQMVEEVINQGKEAIILVPEISLTPQTIERFKGRFDEKIAIIHSRLTPSERFDQWRMINNGEVKIAIGARSAIFAPFKNLGIIIIDEEHDNSYISSQDPKYHTNEIAKFRANYNNCNLILASATPSINTMSKTQNDEYELIHLTKRINNNLPDIEIVDLKEELKNSNYSIISYRLQEEIRNNIGKKEQTILFLNKIGHNSYTFCRTCGYVIKCEACDVAMTYHKNIDKLICHYCGRTQNQPKVCPNCHSKKIKEFGAGTEKLEEEVRYLFPDANIMRMDSMKATNKSSYHKMYLGMKNNDIDILLGTQMIAKGLDFKNVTLVGIISADLSLNVGDFRAQENTFELLTQVSGRSGRDKKKGKVIIQTYRPDNFVIQAVKNNDYPNYYKNELIERSAFSYPPYKNIISIKIIDTDRIKTIDISREFTTALRNNLNNLDKVEIIGPNPCKISRINNKHRYNIIIKAEDDDLDFVRDTINKLRNEFINKYKQTSFIPALNPTNIN